MKIIPYHNLIASKVKSWRQIRKEAQELREYINRGNFEGHYSKAYAISHAQVSNNPLTYFVVNEEYKDLIDLFGSWCVINLKIIKRKEEVYWKEACLSFPFREPKNTDRFNKVTVKYSIPFFGFTRLIKRDFVGLPAFIVQHEFDHARGVNLYGRIKQ